MFEGELSIAPKKWFCLGLKAHDETVWIVQVLILFSQVGWICVTNSNI